jgi:hypothetical protein
MLGQGISANQFGREPDSDFLPHGIADLLDGAAFIEMDTRQEDQRGILGRMPVPENYLHEFDYPHVTGPLCNGWV